MIAAAIGGFAADEDEVNKTLHNTPPKSLCHYLTHGSPAINGVFNVQTTRPLAAIS